MTHAKAPHGTLYISFLGELSVGALVHAKQRSARQLVLAKKMGT